MPKKHGNINHHRLTYLRQENALITFLDIRKWQEKSINLIIH